MTHRDASSPSEAMPVVEDIIFEDIITEDRVDDLISEDGGINLMKMFNVNIVVMGDGNIK